MPQAEPDKPTAQPPRDPAKLAHTIKEVRKLVGIGNTTLYRAIQKEELCAVKYGKRTLILRRTLKLG
jgi:excisionase family DNA binding protein